MHSKNNLLKFTSDHLTKTKFDEMFNRIIDEKKIIYPMRLRDFSGKYGIPDVRKVTYFDLIVQYIPKLTMEDLFPEVFFEQN
jgi:hypothetical protein